MVQFERRPQSAGRPRLECVSVGGALLVHPEGELDPQACAFAGGLAKDPEHTMVVVDLPEDPPVEAWESVAKLLRRRGRSFRVVLGRPARETLMTAGRLLADRLNRTVVTPDGKVLPAAGGVLFVPEENGSGWLVFEPLPPSWERYSGSKPVLRVSRRFPVPTWDHALPEVSVPTSAVGTAEPFPGGVWIRRTDQQEGEQDVHRKRLAALLPCQSDQLAVVLGCAGAADLSVEDIERFWHHVPADIRSLARFVPYGPVDAPEGSALGQMLADRLGHAVTVYAGLPVVGEPGTAVPQVRILGADGSPGPPAFVQELVYRPADAAVAPPHVLRGHRPPVDGLPEIGTGVYQYAPDAVLEATQTGLWLRSPEDAADGTAVHLVPADPSGIIIHFDADAPESAERMRLLAEEVRQKLDPAIGSVCRVLPAPAHSPEKTSTAPARPARAAQQAVPAAPAGAPSGSAPAEQEAGPVAAGGGPASGTAAASAPPVPEARPEGAAPAGAGPTVAESGPEVPAVAPVPATAAAEAGTDTASTGPTSPAPPGAQGQQAVSPAPAPMRPQALRLESTAPHESAPPVAAPPAESAPPPQGAPAPAPAALAGRPGRQQPAVSVQPVPSPNACAAPPERGIEQERAWLRRAFPQQYGAAANFVARVLSESPGLRGGSRTSADDVVTDLVAVRLYLSGDTERLDNAVRGATVGPHVPLARCVASGLSRLPSYRGATMLRTTLSDAEWEWYRQRRLVTEWGFCSALTTAHPDLAGDVEVLIWSMTARRTALLDPTVPDRVFFLPGTNFKVLGVVEDERRALILRELTGPEIGGDGRVDLRRLPPDDLAMTGLEGARTEWEQAKPAVRLPAKAVSALRHPPGLMVTRRSTTKRTADTAALRKETRS